MLLDGASQSCEANELIYPVRYNQFAFVPDTEGAGTHRGGLATVREWQMEAEETQLQMRNDRTLTRPWGLAGGEPGAHSKTVVSEDGQEKEIRKETLRLKPGSVLRLQVAGAGGWGDPALRDPERVLNDVIEGKISPSRARDVYKVAVDAGAGTIDVEETKRLRTKV